MNLLLRPLEALIVAASPARLQFPPTFVVGAPRSGTTLVGLHLSNCLRFACLPNVAKFSRHSPYLSTRRALARERPVMSYESDYGRVEGDLAPSDGWHVLARFFPPRVEAGLGDVRAPRRLVSLLGLFERLYGAPMLIKNNANSMRVRALATLFPQALFVRVRRALPEAAVSLAEAYERHDIAPGRWWSAGPPRFLRRTNWADAFEQAVATHWDLDGYVPEQLERLAPGRWTSVDYDRFCEEPGTVLEWVRARYAERGVTLDERPGPHPTSFRPSRLEKQRRVEVAARIGAIVEALESELAARAAPDAGPKR